MVETRERKIKAFLIDVDGVASGKSLNILNSLKKL